MAVLGSLKLEGIFNAAYIVECTRGMLVQFNVDIDLLNKYCVDICLLSFEP